MNGVPQFSTSINRAAVAPPVASLAVSEITQVERDVAHYLTTSRPSNTYGACLARLFFSVSDAVPSFMAYASGLDTDRRLPLLREIYRNIARSNPGNQNVMSWNTDGTVVPHDGDPLTSFRMDGAVRAQVLGYSNLESSLSAQQP